MNRSVRIVLTFTFCTIMGATAAHAQASRTWVSGVGDDANPCSRTAPCKTFAGAISKTAAGGEISVLNPGGYGQVTINKSITIDGDATLASIQVSTTNGITINGAGIFVTIRNLSLIGMGSGLKGISLVNGAGAMIDHVAISGFDTGVSAALGTVTVINSTITQNRGFGVRALGGTLTVENSMLANNGVAVQSDTGATINLADNGVYNNLTGFGCGGGILASTGDNRKANNVGGIVPTCSPDSSVVYK
jgi:hypothetical protein